ncbi:MAG: GTPase Era [Candidatus Kapabacteria bacterium]|nr:GTPase Era [Candidatus Kapabacteria bacterium]
MTEKTRAGFVAILGMPNAGKSTFLNKVLDSKLAIVSPKPQTTRKRLTGIFTTDNYQIVFYDNPGLLEPKYELHQSMKRYIEESLQDCDIITFFLDITKSDYESNALLSEFFENLRNLEKPKLLILNKIDLLDNLKLVLPIIKKFDDLKVFDEIIPISAIKGMELQEVINTIVKYLPESPFYYDPENISDLSERFFVSEIIRELIFFSYHDEIPFSTDVVINEFKERKKGKWFISADIYVEKNSHKGIIIGENGKKLKLLGENARLAIERHLGTPVYLELFVKLKENWRNDPQTLKNLGY